jgi:hypothetical protein
MTTRDILEMPSERNNAFRAAADFGIDVSQLEYLLTLTPLERLIQHDRALELVLAVRQAGIRYYGFDPRLPEASERL